MSPSTTPQPTFDNNKIDGPKEASGLAFMSRAVRADPRTLQRLDDSQIVQIIRDTAAELAQIEALQLRAIASLDKRRGGAPSAASELALALSITDNRAGTLISAAKALTTRLPHLLQLMDQGELDFYRALKITDATSWLSDEHARTVDRILVKRVKDKTADQIRKAATYAATRVDKEGSQRRTEQQHGERRVLLHHKVSGLTHLSVNNVRTEKATAAYLRIDQMARAMRTPTESRTLDQLRADIAVDLLLTGDGGTSERAEVFLYLDLATYLKVNHEPAEMSGYGSIPASVARRILSGPDTTLRRIITDPLTGQMIELGKTRYKPDSDEFVQVRDRECRQPGCQRPALRCGVEATRAQGKQPGEADQRIAYCARHRNLKNHPAWRYEVAPDGELIITTPAGETHPSTSPPLHQPRRRSRRAGKGTRK
jgi:hypothetical protein